MSNPNHDQRGRFSSGSASGAASGDHQAASPSTETRNVSGRTVDRSIPVTRHGGAPSVGTEPVRLDNSNSPSRKRGLGSAKQDRIVQMRAIDQRHYGIEGDLRLRLNAATLATPKGSFTATPGRFKYPFKYPRP